MTIDIYELWDYSKPELSEQRFREALASASADDALILQTQIARTYGLRSQFSQAQAVLAGIEPQILSASTRARVHYYLEMGRTHASAAHSPESQTPDVKELARSAYLRAFELARDARLDRLAIDALHMMTFVDTAGEEQIEWNRRALEYMQASSQPEAKKWEGSLRNNMGYALHSLGHYEQALQEFELALAVRQRDGNAQSIRIAWWMIAWTLRTMSRLDEALAIQLRLESECDAAGEPDPYVYEELEHLYRALEDTEQAEIYAERRKAAL
jgi:tetratricopeptide (TPR) repeat protein